LKLSLPILTYYVDYMNNTYYANSTTALPWKFDFTMFNMDSLCVSIRQRYQSQVQNTANNKGEDNILPWVWYRFGSQGSLITERIYYPETVTSENRANILYPRPVNMIFHSFDQVTLKDRTKPKGTLNFKVTNSPRLEIQPDPTVITYLQNNLTDNVQVDVVVHVANWIAYERDSGSGQEITMAMRRILDT